MPNLKNKKVVMGVDIGGTKIACGLVVNGKLVTKMFFEKTPKGNRILSVVEKLYKKFARDYIITAVGISTAGMVSNSGKIVGSCGNISDWQGTDVSNILNGKLGLPVIVENDANSAAFAEYHMGSVKGSDSLVMITLGTGVGGGVVINGKLIRGAHFAGGEIGHIQLSYNKERLCTCSKYDCFEAYCSGNGLLALINHYFKDSKKKLSTYELFNLAKSKSKNDRDDAILATRAIEDWHYYIALGIANLVHVLDPKNIVLSGGLSQEVDLNYLNMQVERLLLPALRQNIKNGLIHKSKLKNDAGLIGAALLASQYVAV